MRCGGRFPTSRAEEFSATEDGVIDLAALERRLSELKWQGKRPPLVSVMAANNETGVVQPVRAAADMVHVAGGLLHVYAIQAAGRISGNINEMEADLMTISSHKIGGPQGVGAADQARVPRFISPNP